MTFPGLHNSLVVSQGLLIQCSFPIIVKLEGQAIPHELFCFEIYLRFFIIQSGYGNCIFLFCSL